MKIRCFCKQCGRSYIYNGHNSKDLCDKHRHQIKSFGRFLDANPRTKYDPNEFRFIDNYVEFDTYKPITGEVTGTFKIDTEDYPEVSKYKWCMNRSGYAVTATPKNGKKERILLHRLILKPKLGQQIDHINLDTFDNRKSNLRVCNNSQNQQNRNCYNKYKVKGIEQTKHGKWTAYFRNNGKQYHSPSFFTKEEAAFARFILEQAFGTICLTQHNQELIDKLDENQKENVISIIKAKFSL